MSIERKLVILACLLILAGCLMGCAREQEECTSLACLKDQARHEKYIECMNEHAEQAWDMEYIGMRGAMGKLSQACRDWSRKVVR